MNWAEESPFLTKKTMVPAEQETEPSVKRPGEVRVHKTLAKVS